MNTWFMNLTLARKLVMVLLLVGLLPMIIISVISSVVSTKQLEQQAFDQLDAVKNIKAAAVERYFKHVHSQIITMADTPMVINAAGAFSRTFKRVISSEDYSTEDIAAMREDLSQYYSQDFSEQYQSENDGRAPDTQALLNALDDEAVVMQALYITQNPHALGEKNKLNGAEGRSVYHRVHKKYHASFSQFQHEFGFYDFFIVDAITGDIVYSVFKELDYGSSLLDGPYANTSFGNTFKAALTLEPGQAVLKDFASYTPSYEAPASFIATPIMANNKLMAVLILQIPLEPINNIMAERSGMGKTGESYLVGEDSLMRSDSYLDPINHSVIASFRHPEKGKVETFSVEQALQGKSGSQIIQDYNNNPALSSFSKIDLGDFSWVVIAEIGVSEAFAGVTALKWTMAILALLSAVVIAAFAFYVSKMISMPILQLGNTIQRVEREGNFQLVLQNKYTDEIGDTSRAFNSLLTNLSSSITGTNSVLEELGKGNFEETVAEHYTGQLGTLTHGVNAAVRQVSTANDEQIKQQRIAEKNSLAAETSAAEAKAQARQTLIIKQALDVCATAVMIADTDFNIIYLNDSADTVMSEAESEIRKQIPAFNAAELMGTNIDIFHKNPQHQRKLLQELQGNYKAQLVISELNFNLSATPIRDEKGEYLGAVVEWENITEKLAKDNEERRIADENSRIRQALDNSSTSTMIADAEFNIIYTNDALSGMMKEAEEDLRDFLGNFNADTLMGNNMDMFHKNPAHQRSLLDNLKTSYQSEVKAGARTFTLTANPIINNRSERIGTVVEWLDRTAEVAIERDIDRIINLAAAGDFSRSLNADGKTGFFLSVCNGLNRLMDTTQIALTDIMRIFSALANGDLSQQIEREYQGEFGKLKLDANTTVEKLREVLENISSASASIAKGANEISEGNTDLSQRTEEQASSLEETASSMEEMITIVKQSEENANKANDLASSSITIAREGNTSVQATSVAMNEISQASTKIANIIGVIDEIAFQTNLLALNAAVEAARAGEQGRGFAVVAGEVRNLAQRSASAAKEIKALIQDSVTKVLDGAELVESSGKTLHRIVEEIERVGSMMQQIFNSAREQTSGIEQVNTAIAHMDQMTQQNAALVEEASATSENLADQAHQLDQMVAFFKR